jgi:hypothetical protein
MTSTSAWPHLNSPTAERENQMSWPCRRRLEIFVVALLGFLAWQGAMVWNGMNKDVTHFPQAFDWAIGERPAGGWTSYSLEQLNRAQPGRAYIGHSVRHVGKSVISTGPFEVSVNAINADTLAMVALGDNGRCYAELTHSYGANNQYGWTKEARFPQGTRCDGLAANLYNVQLNQEPQ